MYNKSSYLNEEASLQQRINMIEALVVYYRVREASSQRRPIPYHDWGIMDQEPEQGSTSVSRLIPNDLHEYLVSFLSWEHRVII